jgi:hypothetical protein
MANDDLQAHATRLIESVPSTPTTLTAQPLRALPRGTHVRGSFAGGGSVPADGAYQLHQGETVQPAAGAQPQDDSQPAGAAPDSQDDLNAPASDEGATEGNVKLQRAYSRMNEAITKLFDGSGVKRSATIPYIDGQQTHEHITAVGNALQQAGGLTKNLLTSFHHSGGAGWGSGDGSTVAHPADALRSTIIPKGSENAEAAISACRSLLSDIEKLLGANDPTVKVAKAQLGLVSKHDAQGMNCLDFGVSLQQICHLPLQSVARKHNDTKGNGPGHVKLQPPRRKAQG